jgi:hypothetical protein
MAVAASVPFQGPIRMHVIRIHKRLDSDTLHLPELKELIGKQVRITVVEEVETSQSPKAGSRYDAFFELAGKDVVDPEAYKQLRAASMI